MADYDCLFKILVFGDNREDTTDFLNQLAGDNGYRFESSIGVDFKVRTMEIDRKVIKLQFWYTCGTERFRKLEPSYYKGALGAIALYDVTDITSYKNMKKRLELIDECMNEKVHRVIIGTKIDKTSERVISYDEAHEFAMNLGISMYEISNRSLTMIEDMISILTSDILKTLVLFVYLSIILLMQL